MVFHRFDANRKLLCYFFVGITFGYFQHENIFPDWRKFLGNGIQVISRFIVRVGVADQCSIFLEFIVKTVLVFTFSALLAEVIDVNGAGDGEELGIQREGFG